MGNSHVAGSAAPLISGLKGFWCWLWSLIRWGYVLLLFLYLFALVTALFQAHGFQQLVSHLIATEDDLGGTADEFRRRVVLIAVKEADTLGGNTDAGQTFLNQVAGRVGGIRTAAAELSRLDGQFRLAPAEGAETPQQRFDGLVERIEGANKRLTAAALAALAAGADAKPAAVDTDGREPAAARAPLPSLTAAFQARTMRSLVEMQALVSELALLGSIGDSADTDETWAEGTGKLDAALRDLARATLTTKAPSARVVRGPAATEATVKEPADAETTVKEQADPEATAKGPTDTKVIAEELADTEAIAALLDAQAIFRDRLDAFVDKHQSKPPRASEDDRSRPACLPSTWQASMQGEWSALELGDSDPRVRLLKAGLFALGHYEKDDLSDELTSDLAGAIKRFNDATLEPAEREKIAERYSVADSAFRDRLIASVEAATEAESERILLAADGTACHREAAHLLEAAHLIGGIRTQLDALDDAVRDGYPLLQLLQQVYAPITRIEAAVRGLGALRVANEQLGADTANADPQRAVEDQLQRLRESLDALMGLLDAERTPVQIVARAIGDNVPDAGRHAESILAAYGTLGNGQAVLTPLASLSGTPDGFWASLGFNAKNLAVSSSQIIDLMVVFVMGAIGSLIYITQYLLSRAIQGKPLSFGAGKSFAWFVFRPIFGVVIAFAIYLLYKAGQIALGAGTAANLSSEVNLPILSSVSLFAGLLSWQVLDLIQDRGSRMFSSARRAPMWAVGLESALKVRGVEKAEVAGHLGVSGTQVQRWIDLVDQVTPEMQDRIAAWLDVLPIEVFSTRNDNAFTGSRVAYCLDRLILEGNHDAARLALELKVPPEILTGWRLAAAPVPAMYQHALVRALDTDFDSLFCPEAQGESQQPATGDGGDVGTTPDDGQDDEEKGDSTAPVSPVDEPDGEHDDTDEDKSDSTAPAQPDDEQDDTGPESDAQVLWAVGLRAALQDYEEGASAQLAAVLDLDQSDVRGWMELDRAVPQDLQEPLAIELESDGSLFAEGQPLEMMAIGDRAAFLAALEDYPAFDNEPEEERLALFAEIIDVDPERLQAWLDDDLPMAPATAKRLRFEVGDFADGDFLVEAVAKT